MPPDPVRDDLHPLVREKAIHVAARQLCYEKYGDWRYDPGEPAHEEWFLSAKAALEAAAPFLEEARSVEAVTGGRVVVLPPDAVERIVDVLWTCPDFKATTQFHTHARSVLRALGVDLDAMTGEER